MKVSGLSRYSLCLSVGIAMLAGCGGSQPPIAARGAMPQNRALAARADTNYKVVYSFGARPDGNNPFANVIDVGGTLYGTSWEGGKHGWGDGNRGWGTVFSIAGGVEKVLQNLRNANGSNPAAGLIDVRGTLYGTTTGGGADFCRYPSSLCGTVFSITPSGTERVLHRFSGGTDGGEPFASLIDIKGTLYGTTGAGADSNSECSVGCGTVFSITPSGTEKTLYNFAGGEDGSFPRSSLIEVKGTLYGTTQYGGAYGEGTVFRVTLGGVENVLHSFGGANDGFYPFASLIDVNGTLYGTTALGGANNCSGPYGSCGTVFSITPSGAEKVLHTFGTGTDGGAPEAPLIDVNGTLYGTTIFGGAYTCVDGGCGTVFSITPSGVEKVLHNFGYGSDGIYPVAALTEVRGKLYGTTGNGGAFGQGTVFSLKP